jgi:hypothetical protein
MESWSSGWLSGETTCNRSASSHSVGGAQLVLGLAAAIQLGS